MAEFTRHTSNGHREDDDTRFAERLRPIDTARAVPRPPEVEKLWIEYEAEKGAGQQRKLHEEQGEVEASAADKAVAELDHDADKATAASDRKTDLAGAESKSYGETLRALGKHDHRRKDAVFVYWLRWLLFVLGDAAGAGGAILLLGEEPYNAIAQAVSVAVCAVTLGGVGRQVRYWVAAKERQKPAEELSEEELEHAQWFDGPNSTSTAIKVLGPICIAGIAAIVGGIFALREAAEGPEVAYAFGGFALALGLASAYNSYDVADQVAEHLEAREARLEKLEGRAAKARTEPVIAERAGSKAESESKKRIAAAAGDAAALEKYRRMYQEMAGRPDIAGHGTAPAGGPAGPADEDDDGARA